MNTRRAGALALTLVLAAIPASAQDARVEAARREGKVVWYTSLALSSSERVAKLFEAAYPGIGVEVHRTGSQRILQRVMQELQANLRLVDVIHTSDAGHFVLLKAKKLLMKYTPVGVDRSEEHTSELQSLAYLVCRLLLEKKKKKHGPQAVYILTAKRWLARCAPD